MVEIASGASIVMNAIPAVNVIVRGFVRINAILAVRTGVGDVAVVIDLIVNNLIVVPPNLNATFRAAADFESVDDVVAPLQRNRYIPIRNILAVNHRRALD